eukprot:3182831-Karenia_brevis.AAC.1
MYVVDKTWNDDEAVQWTKIAVFRQDEETAMSLSIKKFISRLRVTQPRKEDYGITWLELYILYKSMGYACPLKDPAQKSKVKPSTRQQLNSFKLQTRRAVRQLPSQAQD